MSDVLALKKQILRSGQPISHILADLGIKFSFTDVMALGNPSTSQDVTLAHIMAYEGEKYSVQELMEMKNPQNFLGETVSHIMVLMGHTFSFNEIMELGDPADLGGETLSLDIAKNVPDCFSFNQIIALGNPKDLSGYTIGHYMATKGKKFSVDELIELGDTGAGEYFITISDFMEKHGNGLSEKEQYFVKIGEKDKTKREMLWKIEKGGWVEESEIETFMSYPDLVERYADLLI